MSEIDYSVTIRFDGDEAADHEIDLYALGESLKGLARIAGAAGYFAADQKYTRFMPVQTVRVIAKEPKANCYSIQLFWKFAAQHQILSGAFGAIAAPLIAYVLACASGKLQEMRLLKDSLDKAVRELATKDEKVVARLLDIVEKMAVELRPAARQALSPVGKSCKTMTVSSNELPPVVFTERDKAEANREAPNSITATNTYEVEISELDILKGTCLIRFAHEDETSPRTKALITDPALQSPNNPYSVSMAAMEHIKVTAKAEMRDGEIARLFISDTDS